MIVCSLAYSSFSSAYIHHQLFVLPSRFLFSITSFLCLEGIECEKRQRGQEDKGQGTLDVFFFLQRSIPMSTEDNCVVKRLRRSDSNEEEFDDTCQSVLMILL